MRFSENRPDVPFTVPHKGLSHVVGIGRQPIAQAVAVRRCQQGVRRRQGGTAEIMGCDSAACAGTDGSEGIVEILELRAVVFQQLAHGVAARAEIDAAVADLEPIGLTRASNPAERVEPFMKIDLSTAQIVRFQCREDAGQASADDAHGLGVQGTIPQTTKSLLPGTRRPA